VSSKTYRNSKKKKTTKKKKQDSDMLRLVSLVVIFVVIILALVLTVSLTMKHGFTGSDIDFHYELAKGWASGKNVLFNDIAGGPYPPLMHLFLAVFIFFGVGPVAVYTLQILLFPAILAVNAYVFTRLWNIKKAALAVVLLFSSIGFFDRGVQVAPQAFDMLLFPLAAYLYFKKRYLPAIIILSALIYAHGWYAALLIGGLALFVLVHKKDLRQMWFFGIVGLVSLPMIILMVIYLPGYAGFAKFDHPRELQETMLVDNPLMLMEYMGILLSIVIIIAAIVVLYKGFRSEGMKISPPDKFAYLWCLALVPILYFGMHRFITYSAQPLAILAASNLLSLTFLKRHHGLTIALMIVLAVLSIAIGMIFWFVLFQTNESLFITNYI
jgi:hypothetical protein